MSTDQQHATVTVTATMHLHNRTTLITKLREQRPLHHQCDDRELLLAAYQHWGEDCVHHLQGAFVFTIWDSARQTLFCARDRIGLFPFFYTWQGGDFLFANTMADLVRLSSHPLTPNPQWIVDHLGGVWLDNESTFYNEVSRLPPAHTLTVSTNGICKKRYWDFDPGAETRLQSDQAYTEAARERLISAVRYCSTPSAPVGIELSGGLDSTTIAAIAYAERKTNPSLQLSTYSHASPLGMAGTQEFHQDERADIDRVCAFAGIDASYFFTNEQATVLPMIEKAIHVGGGTSRCTFTTLTSGIHAMAAEQGVQVLLSGWGGDELVSARVHSSRYLLRAGAWKPLWRELSRDNTSGFQRTLYRLLRLSFQEFAPFSPPTPRQNYQASQYHKRCAYVTDLLDVSPSLRTYVAGVDWQERLAHWWHVKNSRPRSIREAQVLRITRPWLTNRLEATAQMAATFGIEYRYPLLDVDLMRFFLSLPTDQKQRSGCDRYLFRACTAGLLPEDLRWKKKEPGALYPWYMHSLKNDLSKDIPPVEEDAAEEVQVGRLIAQAQQVVRRTNLTSA